MRRLFDLLALLPPMPDWKPPVRPRDPDRQPQPDWWDDYAKVHNPGWDGKYYRDSLKASMRRVAESDSESSQSEGSQQEGVRRLAEYCLVFFNAFDDERVCKMLDVVTEHFESRPPGAIGRRWAESVCDVAWRLWVPREALRKKTRAERAAEAGAE